MPRAICVHIESRLDTFYKLTNDSLPRVMYQQPPGTSVLLGTGEKHENAEDMSSLFLSFAVFFRICPTNDTFMSAFHIKKFILTRSNVKQTVQLVCLPFNGKSALFRPLVPRIVEIENMRHVNGALWSSG